MYLRLAFWLFLFTVIFGVVGFTSLAAHAASIAKWLCVISGLLSVIFLLIAKKQRV